MATKPDLNSDAVLVPRPDCDPGPLHEGCDGPPPTPWLSWKHCFKIYEFREYDLRLDQTAVAAREGIKIRVRFEHALCPMGRKQGPIVHSLALLPKEEVKIYEFDRYSHATSTSARSSSAKYRNEAPRSPFLRMDFCSRPNWPTAVPASTSWKSGSTSS